MSPRTIAIAMLALALAACRGDDITAGRYQGMIELEQVELGFELGGRVAELLVQPGQEVKPGDPIARQDDTLDKEQREIRARELEVARSDLALVAAGSRVEDIRASRAQLSAARTTEQTLAREVERERALVARGAVAGARLDDLEAQLARARGERATVSERSRVLTKGARGEELARAQSRVALAEEALALEDKKLEKRVVTSPVAGTVLDTFLDPGEIAGAGATVAAIVDRRHPYADVFVPVDEAPRLRIGAAMTIAVEGAATEAAGTVERVFPRAEFTPRYVYSPRERPNLVIRVRVRITDDTGALHAGLPAYARLAAGKAIAGSPGAKR